MREQTQKSTASDALIARNATDQAISRGHSRSLEMASFAAFSLGLLSLSVGFVLSVIESVISENRVVDDAATISFLAGIPLLVVGAHFLDLNQKNRPQ